MLLQDFVKRTAFSRHPSLQQLVFLSWQFSRHSCSLWTKINGPPSFHLELVRLSRGSFLPLARTETHPTSPPRDLVYLRMIPGHAGAPPSRMLPLLVFAASNISFVGQSSWTETDLKVTLLYVPLIVFKIRLVRVTRRTTTFLDL